MAEQREAREIVAWTIYKDRTNAVFMDRENCPNAADYRRAGAILAALDAEGWAVVRLDPVDRVLIKDTGSHRVWHHLNPPLYRVISPSTREAEKP